MQAIEIATTKNGRVVYVDLKGSHAATHITKHPQLLAYLRERIVPTIALTKEVERHAHDMGEVVGTTDLVATTADDDIVYALRPNRHLYARFVKGKSSRETSWITTAFKRRASGDYNLYTAFIGTPTPSFPGGNYLPENSREFWSTHALVWGSQEIVPGTETSECPW